MVADDSALEAAIEETGDDDTAEDEDAGGSGDVVVNAGAATGRGTAYDATVATKEAA